MKRLTTSLLAGLVILGLSVSLSGAGIIGGTVESIRGRTLVVKTSAETSLELEVGPGAQVTLDRKSADFSKIKPGSQVTIFTDSRDRVRKVNVRTAKTQPNTSRRPSTRSRTSEPDSPGKPFPKRGSPSVRSAGTPATDDKSNIWPGFRGSNRNNVSTETGLLQEWPAGGPRLLWSQKSLGAGYSGVAVAHGVVVTMGNQGNVEAVLAMDLRTGRPLWKAENGPIYRDGQGDGPRGTPTIDGQRVYALGANGNLLCAELKTGRRLWQKNILQEFGGRNIQWGISESVLIDGDRLICTPGGSQATMAALNKTNGAVIWRSVVPGNPRAAYASAIRCEVGGVPQYVNFTSQGVIGVAATDGRFLWADDSSSNGTANCSTPLFWKDHIFSASNYGTGGTLLRLASQQGATVATQVFHTDKMKNHHGGMVIVDGHLYGSNDPGILTCIELPSGKIQWENRSVGKGSIIYADGNLILRSENGPIALVAASPQGYQEKSRFDQPQRSNHRSWSHPVVADGKLFLRDMDVLLVYDLKASFY